MSHSEYKNQDKKFITSSLFGFCGGVRKAVTAFESGREKYGCRIYVLHELVHNNFVTGRMLELGAVFVEKAEDIPDGSVVLIGAHGVSLAVENSLQKRCVVIDATCPRVKALQKLSSQVKTDEELILLCKAGHPEAEGVLKRAGTVLVYPVYDLPAIAALPELKNPVFLTQTTVSHSLAEAAERMLKERFSNLRYCGSICDASSRRQLAAEKLAGICQFVIVVGSAHSSNAAELVNVVKACGTRAVLLEDSSNIDELVPDDISVLGITAGASTPDEVIANVKARLVELGYRDGGTADV